MKSKFASFLAAAAVLAATAVAQTASPNPADQSPTKVGIINIQRAIVLSNEGQRDLSALQQKFAPKEAELKKLSQEVEDLKKQAETQADKMNDEARANLLRTIKSKETSLQRSFEDAQGDFQEQQNVIASRIGQKMLETLDKYARDGVFSLILDVSNPQTPVLWVGPAVDITDEIIQAYNVASGVPAPPASASAGSPSAPSATRPAGTTGPPATRPAQPQPQQQRPPR